MASVLTKQQLVSAANKNILIMVDRCRLLLTRLTCLYKTFSRDAY